MGCTNLKHINLKNLNYKPELTASVKEYDNFFQLIEKKCHELEQIRSSIENTRERILINSGTSKLFDEKLQLFEAMQVFLWTVSSNNEGNINNAKPKIYHDVPFIELDKSNLTNETLMLYDDIMIYFTSMIKAIANIDQKHAELLNYQSKIPIYNQIVESKVDDDKSRNSKEYALLKKKLQKNEDNLVQIINRLNEFEENFKILTEEMHQLIHLLPKYIANADVIGLKAFNNRDLVPIEIFNKYHIGIRKAKKSSWA